jgi:hypothetical protein
MDTVLELCVISTGRVVRREVTTMNAKRWHKRWEHRFSKYRALPDYLKEAIEHDDLLVGWANYDDWRKAGIGGDELHANFTRLFKTYRGYDD